MKSSALLALVLLFATPASGLGQATGQFSVEAHGGVALPTGNLSKMLDVGGSVGGSLVWHFHPNWAVRGDIDALFLDDGTDAAGVLLAPPMMFTYVGGGIEINFDRPKYQDVPLTFSANLGAGVMHMDADATFTDPLDPRGQFDEWYLTFDGGGHVGYQATEYLNIFVQTQFYLMLTDALDMEIFRDDTAGVEPFDHAWIIPITGGARLSF